MASHTVLTAGFELPHRLSALAYYDKHFGRPEGSWWDHPLVSPSRGTIMVHKGYARYNATQIGELLEVVDAVVINYGHHYAGASLEEYAADMARLLQQLSDWVAASAPAPGSSSNHKPRLAVFRETGAQHFQGSGEFRSWDQAHLKLGDQCHCAPLSGDAQGSKLTAWNAEMQRLIPARFPLVSLVGFYDITAPRFDMHEGAFCGYGSKTGPTPCCDCTHLCATPQLWRAWFSQLFDAIEAHPQAALRVRARSLSGQGRLLKAGSAVERARRHAAERVAQRAARHAHPPHPPAPAQRAAGGVGGEGAAVPFDPPPFDSTAAAEAVMAAALAEGAAAAERLPSTADHERPAEDTAVIAELLAGEADEPVDGDAPPEPTPPANKFGRAGEEADAAEMEAMAAMLASLSPQPSSNSTADPRLHRHVDAPPERPETVAEADAAAWYNRKDTHAPPGMNSGAAALAAMPADEAAALLAAMDPAHAARLLFNASFEAQLSLLRAMPREDAFALLAAGTLSDEARAELTTSLEGGAEQDILHAQEPGAEPGIAADPTASGALTPAAVESLPAKEAAALLLSLPAAQAGQLLGGMGVLACGRALAAMTRDEARALVEASAMEKEAKTERLGAAGAQREMDGRGW